MAKKIRIKGYKRKGYTKDVKRGPGVKLKRIAPTTVRGYSVKDRGKPGRTPKSQRWFKPKGKLNWSKDEPQTVRLRKAIASRPQKGTREKEVSALRALNALANVTTDRETRREARKDIQTLRRRL